MGNLDPVQLKKLMLYGQIGLLVLIVVGARFLLRRPGSAFFKARGPHDPAAEPKPGSRGPDRLAQARYSKPAGALRLEGIRLDGAAHEILGVRADATEEQIQAAYRELMKRYHPDRVGRPGTREWQDAQGIAETINRAKTELLARFKRKP